MERVIKEELDKGSILLFLLVFVAGFLTSLTPCVYPVIPIVMGYVGSRAGNKKLKGLTLSLFFVLGLAIVYSVLGVIAAQTGSMIGISFQNPVVVILIAVVFILMGLSLAGLFEIPVPASLTARLQSGQKGGVIGAVLVGGVSGIIAAPCVGPVLIALLSWISQTGNVFLGFWLTFTFSLGLGVIFLLAGTFSGVLSSLPKGGAWMNTIKYIFALLLIAGGLYFLNTITARWLGLLLWGLFLVSASVFMGLFKPVTDEEQRQKFFKVVVVLIFLLGAFFLFQSLQMKYFGGPVSSAVVQESNGLTWLSSLESGRARARQENRILMIDTYADWCVACKELENHTFSRPEVMEALGDFVLVKLDFTQPNEANERMRKSLDVIGMPTIIFFDAAGKELRRFSGFVDHKEFLRILSGLK
jgi:thiol:disulfide interchange protein DsbD